MFFGSEYPAVEETHVFVLVVSVLLVSSLHFLMEDCVIEGLELHRWRSLLRGIAFQSIYGLCLAPGILVEWGLAALKLAGAVDLHRRWDLSI